MATISCFIVIIPSFDIVGLDGIEIILPFEVDG